MKKAAWWLFIVLCAVAIQACSPTRHLDDHAYLLRKNRIKLTADRSLSEKSILNDQLKQLIIQRPNTYFAGFIPFKVWLYNIRYKKYQSDTANFQIASKTVEKPVVLDSNLVAQSGNAMISFLHNEGYFHPVVQTNITYKDNKRASVSYNVLTGTRYRIDQVSYQVADKNIREIVGKYETESLLSKNATYSNTLTGEERNRMTARIRDYGYYHFNAQNIFFELDTFNKRAFQFDKNLYTSILNYAKSKKNTRPALDVKVFINDNGDSLAFHRYIIGKVIVFPDYTDTLDLKNNDMTVLYDDDEFRYHNYYVRTSILKKKITIKPGDYYSQSNYDKTIRQLNDLGIFQYVRIRYVHDRTDTAGNRLNCYILLSPNKKYDFNTNVEVSGGDLYAIGTAANVSVTDHNFLKGANTFTTTASYGIEMARNSNLPSSYWKQLYLFSQNFGLNFQLTFPKFLLPVNQNKFSQSALPKTIFNAGFNSLIRSDYFTLQTINASYGYTWNETRTKMWTVRPVFINTLHLSNVSDSFQQKMENIPAISNSYQETFVEGESVEFLFNNEAVKPRRNLYLRLALEESGLLLNAIDGIGSSIDENFGFNYAHYVRFDFDARKYFRHNHSQFAFRFYGGVGVPYSGSRTLPYIKQYFVGGAYSLRGWRPRVLGPGSYYDSAQQNSVDNLFIDQSGDIKLELNGEYRFGILKLFSGAINLNGALFADAGNIWLAEKDSQLPGANFQLNTLYQGIAMSTGAGLRLDFGGFLVLRLDLAFPVKKPYVPEHNGWVIRDIDFGDPVWRRQNLNLNIAIGYPF